MFFYVATIAVIAVFAFWMVRVFCIKPNNRCPACYRHNLQPDPTVAAGGGWVCDNPECRGVFDAKYQRITT